MDQLIVILEGQVVNVDKFGDNDDSDSDGNTYIIYPNEILGLECIRPDDLSLHQDFDFDYIKNPIVLQ